jgi:hypothetical protein
MSARTMALLRLDCGRNSRVPLRLAGEDKRHYARGLRICRCQCQPGRTYNNGPAAVPVCHGLLNLKAKVFCYSAEIQDHESPKAASATPGSGSVILSS